LTSRRAFGAHYRNQTSDIEKRLKTLENLLASIPARGTQSSAILSTLAPHELDQVRQAAGTTTEWQPEAEGSGDVVDAEQATLPIHNTTGHPVWAEFTGADHEVGHDMASEAMISGARDSPAVEDLLYR
jgi:hypothetical protein